MQHQRNAARLVWPYRRELALSLLLVILAALLLVLAPALLACAVLEWEQRRRRHRNSTLFVVQLLCRALAWTWRKLLRVPRCGWHPCEQCGFPIEPPSRARFCSPACRRYAQLRHRAAAGDERALARYEWLRRSADLDPALTEIPF